MKRLSLCELFGIEFCAIFGIKKSLVLVEAKVWEHAVESARFEAAKACLMLLADRSTLSKLLISGQVDKYENSNEKFPPWIPISQGNCTGRN
jgi:hypothetical protein